MSNLFKSKLFLGVMVAVVMLVGTLALVAAPTEAEAACSITTTLRVGSRGSQVACLQASLDQGLVADGVFGPKTKARVMQWQASVGLVADGIFGAKSRAALVAQGGVSGNFPAGCQSASGYSPTTGLPCNSGPSTGLPAGCSSTAGFSATTGAPCNGGTNQTGPVVASLAANNPASSTLVAGQATADLAHFTFTGNGVVTAVVLKRLGVSGDATLSNVYLFDGATRLTDSASVSNNGQVTFSVPAGLFTVSGSKTISVKSDILTGTQGQTVGVMLASFTTAAGTVNANLSGNVHTIATATLAGVSAGTVTPSGATLNPGAGVTVWQSTLSITQRDVWMKRLALRQVGSAPASAFGSLKLYVNGVQVGTATGLDSMGYVTFDLNAAPVLLAAGSRVVRVDADIVSGASRTVQFSLRQAADVDFVDSSFGVNIAPTSTPWVSTTVNTISGTTGGTLTVEKDVSSPTTNVVNGGTDVNLGTFKFTAFGEAIKVETLRATYASSDAAIGSLRNGRIVIGGVQYGSTATLNEDSQATPYTSYTVNYTFMPGVPVMVEIHADIYDNDGTDSITAGTDTLTAELATGSLNAIRQDSLGSFNAPTATVAANALLVASTSLTLSKNATYAAQTTSLPSTNFKLGSWNLAGSSVEDVLLTSLTVDVDESNATADFDEEDITSMYLVVKNGAGVIVAQPSPIATLSSDGQDNSFSINYTLAKNTNVTIELYGNLSDTGTPSAVDTSDQIVTDLTVAGTSLVSGTSPAGTIADVAGQTVTYAAATVTVSKDASSPVAAIAYDNQTVTTLAAKFDTVTAGYNITDLTVTLGATANTVVQNVMLYDGATLVKSVPMTTATTAVFNGISVNVPANSSKVLTVKLQLGAVGVGMGTTGSVITTSIAAATDVVYTNTSTGVSTSSSTEEAGTATGSAMYAYASIPTVASVALPTTALVAGTNTLAKFSVSSNGGTVGWNRIIFSLTKTSAPTIANGAAFSLWNADTNTLITAGTATVRDTADAATCLATLLACRFQFVPSVEQQVSGTVNYALKATVAGTIVDDDYISTAIAAPSVFAAADDYTAVAASGSFAQTYAGYGTSPSFIWSDISGSGHDAASVTVTDWNNDYLVRFLPLDTQTITN